ncbi:MAG: hypothetical protein WCO00_01190 [Rhodospirillaceae bacterium]
MSRDRMTAILGAILLGISVGAVHAAEPLAITAETAARLAADFSTDPCQPLATYSLPLRCQWQGPVTVTPAGDHYRAELPQVTAHIGTSRQLALGTLILDLRPEADGGWAFSLALPSALTLADKAGRPELEIALGAQKIEGHWQPAVHTLTGLQVSLRDLRLTAPTDGHAITIATLSLTGALAESQPGRWGGPVALALGSVVVPYAEGNDMVRLGSAMIDGRVSGLDIALALSRRTPNPPAVAPDAAAPPPPDAKAKPGPLISARHYLTRLHDLFDGAALHIHLADLMVKVPMIETGVSLGTFDYQTALAGLEQGRSTFSVTYEHGPLAVTPPPTLHEFLPTAARFSLSARNLPNDALWQALDRALAPDTVSGEQALKAFLPDADAALTEAGTHLTIERFGIDTPATTVKLTGQAQYDAAAAMGMVAQYDMTIRGFDAAMKELQPAPGPNTLSEETRTMLSMLTMVQVMGLPAKDDAGREARTYKVEVAGTGAILLNGADITMLVQGLKDRLGRKTPPPAAAPRPAGR